MEWRASHILVKDRALAQELLKKIKQDVKWLGGKNLKKINNVKKV